MKYTINAEYIKEEHSYKLQLEGIDKIVTIKKIDNDTKDTFIHELQSIRDIASNEVKDVIDSLRPSNTVIKFKSLYEK